MNNHILIIEIISLLSVISYYDIYTDIHDIHKAAIYLDNSKIPEKKRNLSFFHVLQQSTPHLQKEIQQGRDEHARGNAQFVHRLIQKAQDDEEYFVDITIAV